MCTFFQAQNGPFGMWWTAKTQWYQRQCKNKLYWNKFKTLLTAIGTNLLSKWIGFDKFGKILYGVHINQLSNDSSYLGIRKISVFTRKVKAFKQIFISKTRHVRFLSTRLNCAISKKVEYMRIMLRSSLNHVWFYLLCVETSGSLVKTYTQITFNICNSCFYVSHFFVMILIIGSFGWRRSSYWQFWR